MSTVECVEPSCKAYSVQHEMHERGMLPRPGGSFSNTSSAEPAKPVSARDALLKRLDDLIAEHTPDPHAGFYTSDDGGATWFNHGVSPCALCAAGSAHYHVSGDDKVTLVHSNGGAA